MTEAEKEAREALIKRFDAMRNSDICSPTTRSLLDDAQALLEASRAPQPTEAEWSCEQGCKAPSAVCLVDHRPAPQPTEDDREYDPDLAAFLSQSLDDEPMWSCVVIAKNLHAAGFRRAPQPRADRAIRALSTERGDPRGPEPVRFDPPLTRAEADAFWDAITDESPDQDQPDRSTT